MSELDLQLGSVGALPSAPGIAVEILRLQKDEDATIADLTEVISKDPAIGSKVLKIANSSSFGRPGAVANLRDAVAYLGMRRVNMLALSFSLASAIGPGARAGFDYGRFWTSAAATTVAARAIAAMYAEDLIDEAFIAGLLCDFGQLVLADCAADLYAPVLQAREARERKLHELELALLGATHASIARDLFVSWRLPATICAAVGAHHEPELIEADEHEVSTLARILHLSSCCGEFYVDGREADVNEIVALGNRYFAMDEAACEALFERLREDVIEFIDVLDIGNEDSTTLEKMRADASERLMEQYLDLDRRFGNLSCDLARMRSRSAELEAIANLDSMTGLHARRYLEEMIEKQLTACEGMEGRTGLLMLDIDYFKQINDRHGHLCGDAVLTTVSKELIEAFPAPCMVGRWGGDEFMALCPGVDAEELLELAEGLLSRLTQRSCTSDSEVVRPTVSIGGVAVRGFSTVHGVRAILREVDAQLYSAKEAGRARAHVIDLDLSES